MRFYIPDCLLYHVSYTVGEIHVVFDFHLLPPLYCRVIALLAYRKWQILKHNLK